MDDTRHDPGVVLGAAMRPTDGLHVGIVFACLRCLKTDRIGRNLSNCSPCSPNHRCNNHLHPHQCSCKAEAFQASTLARRHRVSEQAEKDVTAETLPKIPQYSGVSSRIGWPQWKPREEPHTSLRTLKSRCPHFSAARQTCERIGQGNLCQDAWEQEAGKPATE